ncbi:Phenylpyruvate tautomerase PptA, 4-oxalocrotonate tautomerase family [Pseudonocardia thermophila]|uniref:Phenylpyruvate tautomerase PptA, 4-oxalocrotonate tautomerase family n=1 Tax=Pseudonocardia thermophila TaxID=1848 RepID=A0A1M6R1N1_PSETH|nr:tautomerase family protein [Pseudonocardia thermophila]SHK26296.1 Phenylpyruvate tautomerase PptA, 4-oxalocrotonate tautomerase family [Pseudonocardia thermophila]
MPHVIVRAAEAQLVGREAELVAGLTDAVVDVYGEWVRDQAVVVLVAVPAGRWGIGGRIIDTPPPMVEFGINERALARDDATEILARLAAGITDCLARVLGEAHRPGVLVEFRAQHADRTALGGTLVSAR